MASIGVEKAISTLAIRPLAARSTLALRSASGGYSRTGVK
jgi:hypothetical protein